MVLLDLGGSGTVTVLRRDRHVSKHLNTTLGFVQARTLSTNMHKSLSADSLTS